MFGNRSCSLLAWLALLVITVSSCGIHGRYDAKGLREDRACRIPEKLTTIDPPLGQHQNPGIALDYDKLAPRPDPRQGADLSYYQDAYNDPHSVEQLYYDASQGNERARWLICLMETTARFIGRESARYMASLNCQTLTSCRIHFDKLPFSHYTASGVRLLAEVGKGFKAQSIVEGAKQELIGHALVLLVGATIARSPEPVPARPPATTSSAAKGAARFGRNTVGAAELFTGRWGKGSFGTAADSLVHHFEKHGPRVGAASVEQYLNKAESFARNLRRARSFPVEGATEGITRYVKAGRYVDIAPDGSIISFGAL